jgi:hypothetical protein
LAHETPYRCRNTLRQLVLAEAQRARLWPIGGRRRRRLARRAAAPAALGLLGDGLTCTAIN